MNINKCKVGLKVKSKINSLVEGYTITKVLKSVVWVKAENTNIIHKNVKPHILEVSKK